MTIEWSGDIEPWLVPEVGFAVKNWRERIAGSAETQCAALAELPGVKGILLIGSVGRGSYWPMSDIDILPVGGDPDYGAFHTQLAQWEEQKNEAIHAAGYSNHLEAALWCLEAQYIEEANRAGDDLFLGNVGRWPVSWVGLMQKAYGGRVIKDFDGQLQQFLNRTNRLLFSPVFLRQWVARDAEAAREMLSIAQRHAEEKEWWAASLEILRLTYKIGQAFFGLWGEVPQSLSRCASLFELAARRNGTPELAERFLEAARLTEEETWDRFTSAPQTVHHQRDIEWAVRMGGGEDVDQLDVTRDFLQCAFVCDVSRKKSISGPFPKWTGIAEDEKTVMRQISATEEMVRILEIGLRRIR